MKNFLKLGLIATIFTITISGCQQQDNNFYQYPFKTAKINYQISGSSVGSSEVLIKNDKKMIKDQIVKKSLDGKEQKTNRITIVTPEKIYILNMDDKTGQSFKNSSYEELKKIDPTKRQEKLLMNAVKQDNTDQGSTDLPKSLGSEEVAGQKCDKYELQYVNICFWSGIPLKSNMDIATYSLSTQTVATKIELNTNIDDNLFSVPAEYKVTEAK